MEYIKTINLKQCYQGNNRFIVQYTKVQLMICFADTMAEINSLS